MTTADEHSDDVTLAGEYALHLMDAAERRAFETRLQSEPALRQLLAEWDEHFVSLSDEIMPQTPPVQVKGRIERVLFAEPARSGNRLSIWRVLLGAGVAAALALAVLVTLPQPPEAFAPSLTAQVAAEDGSLVVLASYAPEGNTLRVDRQSGDARPGRVLQLWLIAEGATAPVSLGVLPVDTVVDIALPDTLGAALAGGTLAISDEPLGGSPIDAPTGDVLAVGVVQSI